MSSGAHRISRRTPASTAGLVLVAGVTVALATLPAWDPDRTLQTPLVVVLIYVSLAQMWNLLAGFAGLVSIGQQMFVGIGVYSLLTLAEDGAWTPTCRSPWPGWWRPCCRSRWRCSPSGSRAATSPSAPG